MNRAEQRLAEDRGNRAAARGLFDRRLARVKRDLAARSVPERVKETAQEKAFETIDHGLEIARESKGIIAATAGALILWIFRRPVLGWIGRWASDEAGDHDAGQNEKEQES